MPADAKLAIDLQNFGFSVGVGSDLPSFANVFLVTIASFQWTDS
jgi:hypothetical protein